MGGVKIARYCLSAARHPALRLALAAALRAPRLQRRRLVHEEHDGDQRDPGEDRAEVEDRVEAARPAAAERVERRREGGSDDQPAELRRGQEPVGLAPVVLGGDVGHERLGRRAEGRRPDALEQAEQDEPVGVGGGREEQQRHRVHDGSADHHRLAPDDVAQPAQRRREEQRAHVEHRRDDRPERHRGVRLLLEEEREVRDDGAEARPHHELGRADHAELHPARTRRALGWCRLCDWCGGHGFLASSPGS